MGVPVTLHGTASRLLLSVHPRGINAAPQVSMTDFQEKQVGREH